MQRVIVPPKSEWDNLRQPLESGERQFIEYLDKHLNANWEIYIQPAFNGLCPDVIIVNPKVGICIFEVKNWNFDAIHYYSDYANNGKLHLKAQKGVEKPYRPENPVDKLLLYRKEMIHLYTPQLGTESGKRVLFCGLVFPSATQEQLSKAGIYSIFENRGRRIFNKENPYAKYFVISQESFYDDINNVFPKRLLDNKNSTMNDIVASYLKFWLIEPDANKEQRQPLQLDKKQLEFATTRTKSGYRRLKGPAGSGKSIVVAKKATHLLEQGKSVLVVSFNITLCNYLTDLAVREYSKARKEGVWLNFHYLCSRICIESGYDKEYNALFQNLKNDEFVDDNKLCALVEQCLDEGLFNEKYDAILVDEGQDYNPRWWNILRRLLNDGGEMLLVADSTQDIYAKNNLWTDDAMTDCGFSGRWSELNATYRLPFPVIPFVCDYIDTFLPNSNIIKPEPIEFDENDMFSSDASNAGNFQFRWINEINLDKSILRNHILEFEGVARSLNMAFADQTIITTTHNLGLQICEVLKSNGKRYTDIFSTDKLESRRKKQYFFKGAQTIKACTIHSYKGWESKALMIILDDLSFVECAYELIYVALTRIKKDDTSVIYVVCSDSRLFDFGERWHNKFNQS
ncbi:UvrD-helicase domain-containing protein [Moraxella nasovis]|uniref:UvrD-helicase domain-containing protein n=1 Tax=Moraxella nasovis TaxID=2904121 RepID=UPI001F60AA89|nr:UvrD-helicase domain-containing protein [Moraxella nasovis]UNU73700.1 UvrD-helicase domain-containing protein [Moraxella nasovis]